MSTSNSDDVIDSRDVIARIEELEGEWQALAGAIEEAEAPNVDAARQALADWDAENGAELAALKGLQSEAEGYSDDWDCGATLVRHSYFEEYAQELAEDLGAIKSDAEWPCTCIDWERAARELRQDYTPVDFDGVTYWIR